MVAKLYQSINLEYLDMMTEGDDEMRNTMLVMLLEELPAEIGKMRPLLEARDWGELKEVSHKMKSTLAFIGNDDMTEANRQIEHITKNGGGSARIPQLLETLEQNLPNVLADLQDCLNDY